MELIEWIIQVLKEYEKGFKEGKCSYKTKFEDSIPTGV
jgi:hypothetical protein